MSKHLALSKNKHLKQSSKKHVAHKHSCSCGHEHKGSHSCSCGHEHQHEHGSSCSCGCNNSRVPEISCGCGCGCDHSKGVQKTDIIIVALSFVAFVAIALLPLDGLVKGLLFLVPYLACGYNVLFGAARKIVKGEFLDEDFLMSVASIGAFVIGEYPEAVMVMLLYRVGSIFESYALGKSRKSIAELMDLRPDKANLITENGVKTVSPQSVSVGSLILVSPGERIPLDGEIVDGMSAVDTSSLTGESMPRTLTQGDTALSGCVNISSPLRIKATSSFAESTASRILDLVEGAYAKKSKQETFISRFSKIYTPAVVIAALLIAVVPTVFGGNWIDNLRSAIVFLVVSCPCALVISVPLSYFGGIGCASRNGILVKGSNYLEALSKAKTFVVDKTGTLTVGKFVVSDVYAVNVTEDELLSVASAAELYSNHPIARSIKQANTGAQIDEESIMYVEEQPGHGVSAFVKGKQVYVGNAVFLHDHGINCTMPRRNGTAIHVAVDGEYWGHILLIDKLKEGAFDALEALRHMGVDNMVMLTGDVMSAARPLASSLNFDMVKAELLPGNKVSAVEYLLATKVDSSTLAFVGDGVNDAPVLARADVGIAMGAFGSDAAIEAADVVLMDDDIRKLPLAMTIAKNTVNIVYQNIAIALGVKFAILILALLGVAPIGLAVFGDVGVLIIVIVNALRTLRIKM